jgi:SOS-response transcriptional repressor LexA
MDNKAIRLANFRLLMEIASKAEIARRSGINQSYLSQFERGEEPPERDIGDDAARRLETGMGKPLGWMDEFHGSGDAGDKPIREVRLISWAQARRLDEEMDSHVSVDDDATVVYADASVGQGAFALRVRGDSMVDSAGSLSFPDGCIIVVDPTIPPMPGDNVVVKLPAVEEAVFKTLELFDGKQHLKPLNSRYPIAPMPEDAKIIGVVVAVQTAITPRARR